MTRKAEEITNEKAEELEADKELPEKLNTATFSMGCFWGPDGLFGGTEGVYRTRVGYAGGEKQDPTYHSLGGHTETIQIDYNPEEISYEELLDIFWENHNYSAERKAQYASKIFYHTERQLELARQTKEEQKGLVATEILPAETFWLAEDYHQKYYLRQKPEIADKLEQKYSPEQFINSTAAARLNAAVAGKLEASKVEHVLEELDLIPEKLN